MDDELSIDNKILAYLFDPDNGLREDVEEELARLHSKLEALDNMQKILLERHSGKDAWRENFQQRERAMEIARAEITFYEDVWQKVKDSVAKIIRVAGANSAPKRLYEMTIDWGDS